MDIEKTYRSYQNVSETRTDIIKKVVNRTQGVYVSNSLENDEAIGTPILQYNETDWEYIKRLASKCNVPVIVDEQGQATELLLGKADKA